MKNAKQLKLFSQLLAFALGIFTLFACFFGNLNPVYADAIQEVIYYDSTYGAPIGTTTIADYEVYYDSYVVTENVYHKSVPSYGISSPEYDNYCGPLTGMNAVVFNDRWFTNLIPDFNPGMSFSNGNYQYFPYTSNDETRAAFDSLYDLMLTEEVGGTTSVNFRNGLSSYVEDAGYSISYTSFFAGTKTVNFNSLKNAIEQNKVAVIMCSEYNFISSIIDYSDENRIKFIKDNSTIPHMMMVYGYKTYAYYKDGENFRTDTFLRVTSSDGTCELGYMQLNDFSDIDEAYIMTIS